VTTFTALEAARALGLSGAAFAKVERELTWIEQGGHKVVALAELRRWLGTRPRGEDREAVETLTFPSRRGNP
jgi:hypothetical protein